MARADRRRAERAAAKTTGQPAAGAGAVTVAFVYSTEVAYSWHASMLNAVYFDLGAGRRLLRGGNVGVRYGTGGIVSARNRGVQAYLDTKDAEWLLWIDTDMGFDHDMVERLVAAADPVERPVVGALAFMNRETNPTGPGTFRTIPAPTIFDWNTDADGNEGFVVRWAYERDQLVRCAGTGSACILIHRSVFERVRDEFGPVWYDPLRNPSTGELISEDLSFCGRLSMLDIPLHVHTGIRTSHLKHVWLDEDHFERNMPAMFTPAPEGTAAEPTAIIVPVLERPDAAARFMASAVETAPAATVYAVATRTDQETAEAWRAAGATVIETDRVTFAEKANDGYRASSEPWVFLVGDDVRFHPGWLEQAQHVARITGAELVATNDLFNRAVQAGAHATHPLIRRSWIDSHGASWDGPGTVAHEGYRHWYVDNEWTLVAQQAGVFGYAPTAIVEHLHPLAGKAANDHVYDLGQSAVEADQQLWIDRAARYAQVAA